MTNHIKYAYQPKNENMLIFTYDSGAKRYSFLGDSYYIMTDTQRNFMNNLSIAYEKESGTVWVRKADSPEEAEKAARDYIRDCDYDPDRYEYRITEYEEEDEDCSHAY